MNPIYEQMKTSVFERMSLAAAKHGAVNLGQGFPDFGWPDEILAFAARALTEGSNQYAPSRGLPALRDAVAGHYRRHFGQEIDSDHVCITSGATEALGAAILATVQPGEEVIIFTPAYDSYAPMIRRAGATPVEIALQPPGWRLDGGALRAAITPRTSAILFNNPHNPAGRLFDADELETLAAAAREYELIVISDEVWEHVLLDDRSFTPLASLPGMAERVIKVGSAGKIFSLTGWKAGWIVAAPELAAVAARAHQFLTFATAPDLPAAVAFALGNRAEGRVPAISSAARRSSEPRSGADHSATPPLRRSARLRPSWNGGRFRRRAEASSSGCWERSFGRRKSRSPGSSRSSPARSSRRVSAKCRR